MKKIFYSFILLVALGCSENIFDEIADKDTNEAKFFAAKQRLNERAYSEAIDILESIEPVYLQARDRIPVYASAYSGRCGLEFLTLLESLQNTSGGSQTLFTLLMGAFPGALPTNVQDCMNAEEIIEFIGDESARNGDENLLLAFNSLAKIGTILSSLADTDDNGSADATFDQCNNTDFPDEMVRELGHSLGLTIVSLQAIGTDYIEGATDEVQALCQADNNDYLEVFCQAVEPEDFNSNEVQALRLAIGSSDIGIDSCGGNNFEDCTAANAGSCP